MSQPGMIGLVPPPPGVVPNFENPPSTGYKVIIVAVLTWTLATSIVCLRCVKLRITHTMRIDDWLIGVGWVFATGLTVVVFPYVYRSGLGRHAWDVPFSMFNPGFLQTVIAYSTLYQISICFIKLSILLFYLYLSPYRMFQVVVYTLMGITISYTIVGILQIIFRCQPIAKAWDITITSGHCLSVEFVTVLQGCFNATTDCTMLMLPIPLTWKLRVPRRQKFLIVLILMTSSFVCVISIVRVIQSFSWFGSQDPTKTFLVPTIYGLLEANVGTICACLPHLKPLLRRWIPKLLGESEESASNPPLTQVQTTLSYPLGTGNSLTSRSPDPEAISAI